MPLHDHFRGPWSEENPWEGFHSAWINTMVRHLNGTVLPRRFRALPQVHLGQFVEPDLATFEIQHDEKTPLENNNGGELWRPPQAVQTLEIDLPGQDVFEVQIRDDQRARRLVAVVELVSPGNKDRETHRQAFVMKCAAYLQQQISLVIVDVVTSRRVNLDMDLLVQLAPSETFDDLDLFAVAYHNRKEEGNWQLDRWPFQLAVGDSLPTVPLWLAENLSVPLELERSYEETCQVLRIERD